MQLLYVAKSKGHLWKSDLKLVLKIAPIIIEHDRPGKNDWVPNKYLFILLMRLSRQEYCSGLPFPSLVDHVLSELSTINHLSWVALHSMAHSFIELDKAVGCGPCDLFGYFSVIVGFILSAL